MIGAPEFAQMARRPLLIDTARGGPLDEAAVGPALEVGQISGAGFDVTSVEPPSLRVSLATPCCPEGPRSRVSLVSFCERPRA